MAFDSRAAANWRSLAGFVFSGRLGKSTSFGLALCEADWECSPQRSTSRRRAKKIFSRRENGLEPIGVEFFLCAPSQSSKLSRSGILIISLRLPSEFGGCFG